MKVGAILSYLSLLITIIIALSYTPLVLRFLGQSEYGLYALISSIAAYFSVMDMGLTNTIVRYTARNRAVGSKNYEAKLNGLFLILYSIIGLLSMIFGLVILKNVELIFGSSLSVEELKKAKIMIMVLIANFSLSFPLSVFGSIMNGYERFFVIKIINIIRILTTPLITIPFLFLGYGAITMVVITTLVNLSCLVFNLIYCFRNLKIKFYFRGLELTTLKEIIIYSSFILLNVIVDQIYWNTDQLLLGVFTSTSVVAVYAIGMQFITIFKMFSTSISNLFLPRASLISAQDDNSEFLTSLMTRYGRIQFLIIGLTLSGFLLYGKQFISFWAGVDYEQAYYIILIIMLPLTIPLVQNFGIAVLQAKNLHSFRSTLYLIIALLNIVITIPLINTYGALGSAVATAFSLTIGHIIIINIYYHRRIKLNMIEFWKNILRLLIPIVISTLVGYSILMIFPIQTVINLIVNVAIYTVIFAIIIWFGGLNKYEKNLLISIISGTISIFKKY